MSQAGTPPRDDSDDEFLLDLDIQVNVNRRDGRAICPHRDVRGAGFVHVHVHVHIASVHCDSPIKKMVFFLRQGTFYAPFS